MTTLSDTKIFNRVAKHLMTQKKKSKLSDSSMCAYRAPDGCRCAVGCIIPKAKYASRIEKAAIFVDTFNGLAYVSGFGDTRLLEDILVSVTGRELESLSILAHLQNIHDNYPVSKWSAKLRSLAKRRNILPSPAVKKLIGLA